MKHRKLRKLILAALFAALIFVATNLVIPVPMVHGYVNLGDCVILVGAFLLGPIYGAAAGGIGSAMADAILGYMSYVPGTLLIKGLMAAVAALLYRSVKTRVGPFAAEIAGSVAAECIMVLGYFGYEAVVLGFGLAASASIPGNILQGAAGLIFGCILWQTLYHVPAVRRAVSML